MAIQLQTKSDEITRTKDELMEQTSTLKSEIEVRHNVSYILSFSLQKFSS